MTISSKLYDTLKWIAQIFLPALATLYFALQAPATEEVVGGIVAFDAFLGALLGLSNAAYKQEQDGVIHITQNIEGKQSFQMLLPGDPHQIKDKDLVVFKVKDDTGS